MGKRVSWGWFIPVKMAILLADGTISGDKVVELKTTDKLVYCYILWQWEGLCRKGSKFYESAETISEKTHSSVRAVRYSLKTLEDAGLLYKAKYYTYGLNLNCYQARYPGKNGPPLFVYQAGKPESIYVDYDSTTDTKNGIILNPKVSIWSEAAIIEDEF